MFRPSGPDHVLALTGKILGKPHRKWVKFVQIQILHMAKKVKVKCTINSKKLRDCFKWVAPPGHGCPSPPRPRAPPCRDFSPPLQFCITFVFQGRASTAHSWCLLTSLAQLMFSDITCSVDVCWYHLHSWCLQISLAQLMFADITCTVDVCWYRLHSWCLLTSLAQLMFADITWTIDACWYHLHSWCLRCCFHIEFKTGGKRNGTLGAEQYLIPPHLSACCHIKRQ